MSKKQSKKRTDNQKLSTVSIQIKRHLLRNKKNEMASIFRSAKIGEGLIRKSAPRVSEKDSFPWIEEIC